MKHMKHKACNIHFSPFFDMRGAGWGTANSGQPEAEDGGVACQWLAAPAPAPGLGPASDGPLCWPPGLDAAEDRHRAAWDGGAAGDGGGGVSEWATARDGGATAERGEWTAERRTSAKWETSAE